MTDMVAKAILSADADGFVGTVNAAADAVDNVGESATRSGAASRAAASGVDALTQAERAAAAGATQLAGATKQLDAAQTGLTRSNNATRAGFQQLGFQLSDVTAQMSTGTSVAVIFAQQSGQVVQALQLMGGGAEGATSKFGKFIGFLGGGWGIAISVAVSAIGLLAGGMGDAEEASDKLKLASGGLSDAQNILGQAFDLVTGKLKSQNEMIWANIRLMELQKRAAAIEGIGTAAEAREKVGQTSTFGISHGRYESNGLTGFSRVSGNTKAQQILADYNSDRINFDTAVDQAYALDYNNAGFTAEDVVRGLTGYLNYKTNTQAADAIQNTRKTGVLDPSLRRDAPKGRARKPARDDGLEKETAVFGSPLAPGTYRITSGVGKRNTGIKGASRNHKGVDLAAPEGTPVYATQDGLVDAAGDKGSYGNAVYLDHGAGTETRYAHMSKVAVAKGQAVSKGDVIGYVGSTGVSSGNHLHYEMRKNGQLVQNPLNATAPVDTMGTSDKAAEAAEAAAKAEEERMKQLREYGKRAADAIGGINERYKEQPRLIAEAASVTRDLDEIIAELAEKRPPGFEAMIADAKQLKAELPTIILDAPFKALREETEYTRQQQALILQGRYAEAQAMDIIRSLEGDVGALSAERRAEVVAMVEGEEKINDLLSKREAILGLYLDSIGELRGALEQLFTGGSIKEFLNQGKDGIDQLRGRLLTENLFGDGFRALEKTVTKRTVMDGALEQFQFETLRVTNGTGALADQIETGGNLIYDAMKNVAEKLDSGARGKFGAAWAKETTFQSALPTINPELAAMIRPLMQQALNVPITVAGGSGAIGKNLAPTITSMSPAELAAEMAKTVTTPMLSELDRVFGVSFFSKMELAVSGGLSGFWRAGLVGAGLGGIRGAALSLQKNNLISEDLAIKIAAPASHALNGAELGGQLAQYQKSLGLGGSTTGGQIGGALGSFAPIPGGQIVGSVLGSIIGGLFKKKKYGTAVLYGDQDTGVTGNKDKYRDAAEGLGGSVLDGLGNIADALGGEVGSFRTSIGIYKDDYRVSASGMTGKLKGGDAKDFGDDADGAIKFALLDAISDGGIKGISAKMQQALQSNSDLDKAVEEALKVRYIEDIIGGLTASLNRQFQEFERQAAERVRIAREYGFDVVEIEKYNAEQRAKLTEEILADRVGSLQSFLTDMRTGDLSEGSASEKRAALLTEIARVQGEARDGKDGAADELANLSRELVQLSRSAYGTAGAEYAADRSQAVTAAEEIIRIENERIAAAQKAQIDTASAVQQSNVLLDESNALLAQMGTDMAAIRVSLSGATYADTGAYDLSSLNRMSSL